MIDPSDLNYHILLVHYSKINRTPKNTIVHMKMNNSQTFQFYVQNKYMQFKRFSKSGFLIKGFVTKMILSPAHFVMWTSALYLYRSAFSFVDVFILISSLLSNMKVNVPFFL